MIKLVGVVGALYGALAVALGAFGAHALKAKVEAGELAPRMLEVWQTAASYQMTHALALLAVAWVVSVRADLLSAQIAAWGFTFGVLLFSGSLYAMALTGTRALGAVTPLGGVAFILGWAALAKALYEIRPS